MSIDLLLVFPTQFVPSQKSAAAIPRGCPDMLTAFLPAVHTNFNHSGTSCLRDGMMFMLASGRNAAPFYSWLLMESHFLGNPADKAGPFTETCFEQSYGR